MGAREGERECRHGLAWTTCSICMGDREIGVGRFIDSRFQGWCKRCRNEIMPPEPICHIDEFGWVCEACGVEEPAGQALPASHEPRGDRAGYLERQDRGTVHPAPKDGEILKRIEEKRRSGDWPVAS